LRAFSRVERQERVVNLIFKELLNLQFAILNFKTFVN